jgi:hypothetical protein
MSEPRCPHCQTVLPEQATFCAACGNRIAGWSTVPVAEKPTTLPGGQEPTTNMQPTDSLLRVAALSKKKPAARASMLWVFFVVGGLAAGATYYLASRKPAAPPQPPSVPAIAAIPSPAAAAAPVAPMGPMAPPAAAKKSGTKRRAHRIEPLQVATKGVKGVKGSGPLPHKSVATDSQSLPKESPKVAPEAAKAAVTEAKNDSPVEATPQTEEEMKKEAEASIDADGIRFVVKSHLSQVHACYERAFKESSPGGRVEIGFAITPQGAATRVRTETNTTGSDSLASCLEARVKSWQFPKPVGGDYELIYPFVFAAGS